MAAKLLRALWRISLTLWIEPLVGVFLGVGLALFALTGAVLSGAGVTAILILLFARHGGPTAALAAGPGFAVGCTMYGYLQAQGAEWINAYVERVRARRLRGRGLDREGK